MIQQAANIPSSLALLPQGERGDEKRERGAAGFDEIAALASSQVIFQ
jgi:hypothetical protein